MDLQREGPRFVEVANYWEFEVQRPSMDIHCTALYNIRMTKTWFSRRFIGIALWFFPLTRQEGLHFPNDSDYDCLLAVFKSIHSRVSRDGRRTVPFHTISLSVALVKELQTRQSHSRLDKFLTTSYFPDRAGVLVNTVYFVGQSCAHTRPSMREREAILLKRNTVQVIMATDEKLPLNDMRKKRLHKIL